MAVAGTKCSKPIQETRKLICYDLKNNNNKYYDFYIFTDGTWQGRYGRVDVTETYTEVYSNYSKPYEKIYNEKVGKKGYVVFDGLENATNNSRIVTAPANTDLKAVARQIKTNSPAADRLIDMLIAANVHAITETTTLKYNTANGTFSTPLGIITDSGIASARNTLVSISDYVQRRDYTSQTLVNLVNSYFRTVPKNFGMKIPDVDQIFPDMRSIQEQNNILDSLETSLQLVLKGDDKEDEAPKEQKIVFDAKIHLVEDAKILDRIKKLYMATNQSIHVTHSLRVKNVYEIEIGHMARAFEQTGKKVGNVKELWHGTGVANILSILKGGFTTAPPSTAKIAGKAFGNGTYFSDQSTKSLNYAAGFWTGQRNKHCLMFLNDVAMGKEYIPSSSSVCQGWNKAPAGYNSVFATPGKTQYLQNNEMIVFDVTQINPKYLVEFE